MVIWKRGEGDLGRRLPVVDEFIVQWVTWFTLHDVRFSLLVGKRDGRYLWDREIVDLQIRTLATTK